MAGDGSGKVSEDVASNLSFKNSGKPEQCLQGRSEHKKVHKTETMDMRWWSWRPQVYRKQVIRGSSDNNNSNNNNYDDDNDEDGLSVRQL